MRVLISGSTGLVGGALAADLSGSGVEVGRLVRPQTPTDVAGVRWDPATGVAEPAALEGWDAVIHLAGENIGAGRWTAARKDRIYRSRVDGTRRLAAALAGLDRRPEVLVCASAVGYYGDRGEEELTEDSPPGSSGFLPKVVRDWEAAARPAAEAGMRVVQLRFGVILSAHGGALPRMLLPFRLGLGGRVGDGRQWMSWLTLVDTVAAIRYAMEDASLQGPVNATSPSPVTNQELTRVLGKVLRRPTLFPLPSFAARLVFGEMGQELLLGSTRALPARLQAAAFRFLHPDLEGALRHVLGS